MSVDLRSDECDKVIRTYVKGEPFLDTHLPEDCVKADHTFMLEASEYEM